MRVPTDEKYQRDVPCDTCDGIGRVFSQEIKINGVPATMRCQDCRQAREASALQALREEKAKWEAGWNAAYDTAAAHQLNAVMAVLNTHAWDGDNDYDCWACTESSDDFDPNNIVEWPCDVVKALIEAMEAITRMEAS